MYTELNMWEFATKLAEETTANVQDVLKLKAQTQQDKNDLRAAALTYEEVGDYIQAINIYSQNKYYDSLVDLARRLNKLEVKALAACVNHFRKIGNLDLAAEMLVKMGDLKGLMALHIERQYWDEAFKLGETSPELVSMAYLPYAKWLSLNDKFVEAQEYFRKAGRVDLAVEVMEELSMNAVCENRFQDASFYYHLLSLEHFHCIPDNQEYKDMNSEDKLHYELYNHFKKISEVYFAYQSVVGYLLDPFTPHQNESLFNMCRFILNMLPIVSPYYDSKTRIITPISKEGCPPNLSIGLTLFALAKTSHKLNANHISYQVLDRLYHHYHLPIARDHIERMWILSKGRRKAGNSSEDAVAHLNVCFSCVTENPLIDWKWMGGSGNDGHPTDSNSCARCGEKFIRGFYRFENLPVVSFQCQDETVEKKVQALFHGIWEPQMKDAARWQENKSGGGDQLILVDEDPALASMDEIVHQGNGRIQQTTILKASDLSELTPSRVFIIDRKKKCFPPLYYKTVLADSAISMCRSCFHFFDTDDYEFLVLQGNCCPFCRSKIQETQ